VINDLIKIRFNGICSAKRITKFLKTSLKSLHNYVGEIWGICVGVIMLLRIVILVIYDGVVVIDHVDLNHAFLPSYDYVLL